jgi:pimeloyl-ACP methyl ester carboxylesterase
MKLFYRKYGDGPPLFILHGLYGSSDNWVTIARKTGTHFTVYLPDQRNHGRSPHSDVHDYEAMSSDLFELVTDLRLGKFFLAGHSMGGKTAVRFALRWPEMLEGLMVADISPFETKARYSEFYNQHITILNTLAKVDISLVRSRAEIETLLAGNISSARIRGLVLKNIERGTDGKYRWKNNNTALLKNIDIIMDSIVSDDGTLDPVTGFPVVFLKGDRSDYLPREDHEKILRLFPAAEFRIIKNSGHWIHVDNPVAVIQELINLLRSA